MERLDFAKNFRWSRFCLNCQKLPDFGFCWWPTYLICQFCAMHSASKFFWYWNGFKKLFFLHLSSKKSFFFYSRCERKLFPEILYTQLYKRCKIIKLIAKTNRASDMKEILWFRRKVASPKWISDFFYFKCRSVVRDLSQIRRRKNFLIGPPLQSLRQTRL